jgi:hypothetical protein
MRNRTTFDTKGLYDGIVEDSTILCSGNITQYPLNTKNLNRIRCDGDNPHPTEFLNYKIWALKFSYTEPQNAILLNKIEVCTRFSDHGIIGDESEPFLLCLTKNYLALVKVQEYSEIVLFFDTDAAHPDHDVLKLDGIRTIINISAEEDPEYFVITLLETSAKYLGKYKISKSEFGNFLQAYPTPYFPASDPNYFGIQVYKGPYTMYKIVSASNYYILQGPSSLISIYDNLYISQEALRFDTADKHNFISIYSTQVLKGLRYVNIRDCYNSLNESLDLEILTYFADRTLCYEANDPRLK